VVTLCIEATEQSPHRARIDGLQILEPGTVDAILGQGREVLLRDDVRGDPLIFGSGAGLVRSDALLRLSVSSHTPAGLLAFGTMAASTGLGCAVTVALLRWSPLRESLDGVWWAIGALVLVRGLVLAFRYRSAVRVATAS